MAFKIQNVLLNSFHGSTHPLGLCLKVAMSLRPVEWDESLHAVGSGVMKVSREKTRWDLHFHSLGSYIRCLDANLFSTRWSQHTWPIKSSGKKLQIDILGWNNYLCASSGVRTWSLQQKSGKCWHFMSDCLFLWLFTLLEIHATN